MNSCLTLFVINPIAGDIDKTYIESLINDYYEKDTYKIYHTKGLNDKKEIERCFHNFQIDKIIAIGGDGTISLCIEVAHKKNIKIGIIPQGSANGLATDLNIPSNPELALELTLNNTSKKIDLLDINKHICIHISDIGVNANLIASFSKDNIRGLKGYAKHFFKQIYKSHIFSYRLNTKTKRKKGKAYMIAFANAKKYGTGIALNNNGKIDDGVFEVCIIKSISIRTLLLMLLNTIGFNIKTTELKETITTDEVNLYTRRPRLLQIDGEVIGKFKKIKCKILPKAVEIITL